jgi:hypothetical protein
MHRHHRNFDARIEAMDEGIAQDVGLKLTGLRQYGSERVDRLGHVLDARQPAEALPLGIFREGPIEVLCA